MSRRSYTVLTLAALLTAGACSSGAPSVTDPTGALAVDIPAVLSVLPAAGATNVDPTKPVVLTFNMAMMSGMEMLVVVHEGTVAGPQVAGSAVWSSDRRTMTFTPATVLKAKTTYVVHLSPSLAASNGKMLDLSSCTKLGAQSVSGGMMGSAGGGMMNGGWGQGMMGAGWKASDGTFGMQFTFTTA